MKTLFFLLSSMNLGGVERAFLNMIDSLPEDQYEIHLGLIHKKGLLLDQVPSRVKIHEINDISDRWDKISKSPFDIMRSFASNRSFISFVIYGIVFFICWLCKTYLPYYRFLFGRKKYNEVPYDAAIAYAGPCSVIDYYICNNINARKKFGWIHFDVSRFYVDAKLTQSLYQRYDKVFTVSQSAMDVFAKRFQSLEPKLEVLHNSLSADSVRSHAVDGETFADGFDGIKILTVGRVSVEKGQERALRALAILKERGYNVKWYFIGGGGDYLEECKLLSEKSGLGDIACFLGPKFNPYGYMKDCDIYMQPSLHEGFCITLAEILSFSAPIVSTSFSGAEEQLAIRRNAVITGYEPIDIANGIEKAMHMNQEFIPSYKGYSEVNKMLDLI